MPYTQIRILLRLFPGKFYLIFRRPDCNLIENGFWVIHLSESKVAYAYWKFLMRQLCVLIIRNKLSFEFKGIVFPFSYWCARCSSLICFYSHIFYYISWPYFDWYSPIAIIITFLCVFWFLCILCFSIECEDMISASRFKYSINSWLFQKCLSIWVYRIKWLFFWK